MTQRARLGYSLGAGATAVLTRLLASWQVEGARNVPGAGPLIVAANHFSFVDPPLLAASVPRRLTFFAKAELWQHAASRIFCNAIGVLPIRRGEADRAALRQAIAVLRADGAIAFFPEGTRGREWPRTLKPARAGVAFLARLSGAPVLPVGISGTEVIDTPGQLITQAVRRPHFLVCIGPPFYLERRADLDAGTQIVMQEIARLLPERYRGAYGAPIVEP